MKFLAGHFAPPLVVGGTPTTARNIVKRKGKLERLSIAGADKKATLSNRDSLHFIHA
ncbi:MAG: hypothetical protein H6565_12985 [Lewinellaceae bacterium]|nr:hypothetical protein [Lewinellaceae bacterium]